MKRFMARGTGGSGGPAIRWGPRDGFKGTLEGGGTIIVSQGEFSAQVEGVELLETEFGNSWMIRMKAPPFEGVMFVSERYIDLSGMGPGFYTFRSERDPERKARGRALYMLSIEERDDDLVDPGPLEKFAGS